MQQFSYSVAFCLGPTPSDQSDVTHPAKSQSSPPTSPDSPLICTACLLLAKSTGRLYSELERKLESSGFCTVRPTSPCTAWCLSAKTHTQSTISVVPVDESVNIPVVLNAMTWQSRLFQVKIIPLPQIVTNNSQPNHQLILRWHYLKLSGDSVVSYLVDVQ